MNFEVVFNKKTYSFPEDLKEYIKLLDVVQKIENSLFNSFVALTKKSDINVIDATEMNSSFKNQASIFIEKLCSKDIYNKTIDDYAFNNEGYKEFERINQNALNAYAQFLSDEMSNYLAGMEQAEQNAASQITGSGIMVFTSSPLTLAATTAAEYSILKKQANKADEQYRRELAEVSRRGASEKDRKVNQYIVEHYYPEAKQAFEIFASVILDRYLSDLINADKFDKETYNYIDLKHSQNLLESLKISSNKEAILEQAFLACPFNPFVFVEASNLGLIDNDTYSTAEIFNSDNAVRENLYDRLGEVSSNSTLSLEEKLQKADKFLPSLCAVNNRNKEYYYAEIGKQVYNKTISAYSKIQSDIADKKTCKKIIFDFGEGFFDNSADYQKTLINSYVEKRVKSIISNDDFNTLINKCGYNDLIEIIAPDESVESITKQDIDDYYINGFSKAISSLLEATEIEHKLHKQQEKEEKEQKEISKKNSKIIVITLLIGLLIVPVIINIILGVSWKNKTENNLMTVFSETLENSSLVDDVGGLSDYKITGISIYRSSEIDGTFVIVPKAEFYTKSDVDNVYGFDRLLYRYSSTFGSTDIDININVPFYISIGDTKHTDYWVEATIITPSGKRFYNDSSDLYKDKKLITPVFSRQFIKFYIIWILILLMFFWKFQKAEFDLDLIIKNESVRNKLNKLTSNAYNFKNIFTQKNKKYLVIAGASLLLIIVMLITGSVIKNNNEKEQTLLSSSKSSSNSFDNSSNINNLIENDNFLSTKEIIDRFTSNLNYSTKNQYLCQENESGGIGFYKQNDSTYTYMFSCFDDSNNDIDINSDYSPYAIAFYIITSKKEFPVDDAICFFQSTSEDKNSEDITKSLNNQIISTDKRFSDEKTAIVYGNNIYYVHLYDSDNTNKFIISLLTDGINVVEKDPVKALGMIYINDDEAKKDISNMSESKAKTLLDYYISKNGYGLEDYQDLLVDSFIADHKSDSNSSNTYTTMQASHSCIVCGKSASHSLTGFSGETEYYCDEHWEEMNGYYNKIVNGD